MSDPSLFAAVEFCQLWGIEGIFELENNNFQKSNAPLGAIIFSCIGFPNGTVIIAREYVGIRKAPPQETVCRVDGVDRQVRETYGAFLHYASVAVAS